VIFMPNLLNIPYHSQMSNGMNIVIIALCAVAIALLAIAAFRWVINLFEV